MPEDSDRTVPSRSTREEEERDARVRSGDHPESRAGSESDPPDAVPEEAAEHYEEMIDRGAKQKGEGRLP